MALTFVAPNILAKIGITWSNPSFPPGGGTPVCQPVLGLTPGTGAGQFDTVCGQNFTIANSGSPFTFNLNSGNKQVDQLTAAAMVRLLALIVLNLETTSGHTFTVGAGTHPVITNGIILNANPNSTGSVLLIQQDDGGLPVTSGSTDTLTIATAAGTSCKGQFLALGCSV